MYQEYVGDNPPFIEDAVNIFEAPWHIVDAVLVIEAETTVEVETNIEAKSEVVVKEPHASVTIHL